MDVWRMWWEGTPNGEELDCPPIWSLFYLFAGLKDGVYSLNRAHISLEIPGLTYILV